MIHIQHRYGQWEVQVSSGVPQVPSFLEELTPFRCSNTKNFHFFELTSTALATTKLATVRRTNQSSRTSALPARASTSGAPWLLRGKCDSSSCGLRWTAARSTSGWRTRKIVPVTSWMPESDRRPRWPGHKRSVQRPGPVTGIQEGEMSGVNFWKSNL